MNNYFDWLSSFTLYPKYKVKEATHAEGTAVARRLHVVHSVPPRILQQPMPSFRSLTLGLLYMPGSRATVSVCLYNVPGLRRGMGCSGFLSRTVIVKWRRSWVLMWGRWFLSPEY